MPIAPPSFRAAPVVRADGKTARRPRGVALLAGLILLTAAAAANAQVEMPSAEIDEPIVISADRANRWEQGAYEVWLLSGNCAVSQGPVTARSREAVIWIDRGDPVSNLPTKVIAYFEDPGGVVVEYRPPGAAPRSASRDVQRLVDFTWMGRFYSQHPLQMRLPVAAPEPTVKPAIYRRSIEARSPGRLSEVQPAQYLPATPPPAALPQVEPLPPAGRRVLIRPRSSVGVQARWFPSPDGRERIAVITSGVNLIVEGVDPLGKIDVETDRIVIWTSDLEGLDLSGEAFQRGDVPLEIYMEGNIVFRQGDRVIYAQSMYYDVARQTGVVMKAEMLTPAPEYQGLLRLKADVLQQLDRSRFQAIGAAATSSRLGVPRYWIQSQQIDLVDHQTPIFNPFTGQPEIDPVTGDFAADHRILATSRNNYLYLLNVPVFYWPVLATDVTKPSFYVDNLRIRNDRIFGFQLLTDLDMYQILGCATPPEGTDWTLAVDVLSKRGLGLGTTFEYERLDLFGLPGSYRGELDAWGIKDDGVDVLGADRNFLIPDQDWRGRVRWQHHHHLPYELELKAELGAISDRNFLEQFYEDEWDTFKDQDTRIELKQRLGHSSWSVSAQYRLNDFFTETNRLPRLDHFVLGQSLLGDYLRWHAHSFVEYAQLRTTDALGFADMGVPMFWERPDNGLATPAYDRREGIRAATRQELDLPMQLGPVKVVPYVLGEVAHWQEDREANDVTRAYGQLGVRASLPLWRADPSVQSTLWNLNGLAHKVTFDAELLWADANRDLDRFPLYDPLDDNAQEHFLRRILAPGGTFDGYTADDYRRFDPRFFALRSGMQRWVTAPSTEIADDLTLLRLGARQRWQTKRGLPGRERTVDWIVLDTYASVFPNADRDNFGQTLGLIDYDFRWHLGDRFTLLSDGLFDVFSDGLSAVTLGGLITRPDRGSLYLGVRSIEGPISSHVLTASLNYRMSEKWIAALSTSVDLGPTGNIGQSIRFVRIGESFLVSAGLSVDEGRDNVGAHFTVEPRFLPGNRLGRVAGVSVPPAGAFGLE